MKYMILKSVRQLLILVVCMMASWTVGSSQSTCEVHDNYKDIVSFLEADAQHYYTAQVSQVNAPRLKDDLHEQPTHYFSCYGAQNVLYDKNNCELKIPNVTVYFSDRDLFKGEVDQVTCSIDMINNSFDIILHSWGDVKTTYNDVQRKGNMLYTVLDDGTIIAFSLAPRKSNLR